MLRCAQEVLTNTLRHADASNLWVSLTRTSRSHRVCARDDGRGDSRVNAQPRPDRNAGTVRGLGGTVDFHTKAGAGFQVDASLPVAQGSR